MTGAARPVHVRGRDAVRLSVVIPTLNEALTITRCLEPLQPLRQRGHEVIVADGGSLDDTVRLAEPFANRVIITLPGRAVQMNAGAGHARGDILVFLHADTELPPNADEILLASLATGETWGRLQARLDDPAPIFRLIESGMELRSRLTGIATGDQVMCVTRALFARVGGFAMIPLMEDIELSARLRRVRWPVPIDARAVTSARRWRSRGVLRTILLMWTLRLRYGLGVNPAQLAREYD